MQEYGIELAGIQEVDINTSRNPIDMMEEFMNAGYFTDNHFQRLNPLIGDLVRRSH